MFKKLAKIGSSLGAFALVALSQVTTSGTVISLEASDVTTIGTAIQGVGETVLGIFIAILPYALGLAAVFLAIKWIKSHLPSLRKK